MVWGSSHWLHDQQACRAAWEHCFKTRAQGLAPRQTPPRSWHCWRMQIPWSVRCDWLVILRSQVKEVQETVEGRLSFMAWLTWSGVTLYSYWRKTSHFLRPKWWNVWGVCQSGPCRGLHQGSWAPRVSPSRKPTWFRPLGTTGFYRTFCEGGPGSVGLPSFRNKL